MVRSAQAGEETDIVRTTFRNESFLKASVGCNVVLMPTDANTTSLPYISLETTLPLSRWLHHTNQDIEYILFEWGNRAMERLDYWAIEQVKLLPLDIPYDTSMAGMVGMASLWQQSTGRKTYNI